MAFSSGDPIEYGKELADRSKNPWDFAGQNVMDQFKKRQDIDYELQKTKGMLYYKNNLEKNNPKETAMANYYNSAADLNKNFGGSGGGANNISALAEQAGMSEEDYIQNPTVTRYKGQMKVDNAPQLKPPLDPKSTTELGAFRRTRQNLGNNLKLMTPDVEKRMSPFSYGASRMPGSNFALKAQGMMGDTSANDFSTFKSETDKVFQQFRKETTGAQAALKELGWLEPDYPMPSDPPDLYKQKANEAMKRLEEGEKLLLDLYSQRGFRVGELRKGMNPIQEAAANQSNSAQEPNTPGSRKTKSGKGYTVIQ